MSSIRNKHHCKALERIAYLDLGEFDDAAKIVEDRNRWWSARVEARERFTGMVNDARRIGRSRRRLAFTIINSSRKTINARRQRDSIVVRDEAFEHVCYEDDEMVDVDILKVSGQLNLALTLRFHAPGRIATSASARR